MTHEPMERDEGLGEALSGITGTVTNARVDWSGLRGAINARAASELTRRRARRTRMRFMLPASVAASIALFVVVARAPHETPAVTTTPSSQVSIEELLDANVSDGEFRALLTGATEIDDLLAIAAEEERP